jgi:hypothetical protein
MPNIMEIWEPNTPGTLWVTPALLRETFTFSCEIKIKIMEEEFFKYYLPIAKCVFRHTEHTYKAFSLFPYLTLRLYKYAPMLCLGTFLLFNHNIYGTYFFPCGAINTNVTLNLLTTTIVAPPSDASKWQMGFNSTFKGLTVIYVPCGAINTNLTLNLLTTTIVALPSDASKWQMGFNSAFKGLTVIYVPCAAINTNLTLNLLTTTIVAPPSNASK